MRWKTTLILLLAVIVAGAYVSLVELKRPTSREKERLRRQVIAINPQEVTQIAVDLPLVKGTFTREGQSWKLAPKNVRANTPLITSLLGEASPLYADRVLSSPRGGEFQLKDFGLDPAVGWTSVAMKNGITTLFFGDAAPVGGGRYVKVSGRPEVFIVPQAVFEQINQKLDVYRDPLLVDFQGWVIKDVGVKTKNNTFSLTRQESEWQMIKPVSDSTDQTAMNAFLNQLEQLQIRRFVDDAPQVENISTWGFDQPRAEIAVSYGQPAVTTTLFFGKPLPDDGSLIYAKQSNEPSVYAVALADLEQLIKDPRTLRSKVCFQFFTANVTKVETRWPGHNWTIEKQADGQWKEFSDAAMLDKSRVETLLNTLADLRLNEIVEDAPKDKKRYGLGVPRGTLTVWTTDRQLPQRIEFGKTTGEAGNLYAFLIDRQAVAILPAMLAGLLDTVTDQWKPSADAARS